MTYKQGRTYQNIQLMDFEEAGKYGIPKIEPFAGDLSDIEDCEWIGFNYALGEKHPENKGVHFYLDDYQFERLWRNPERYIDLLRRFKYVLAPDFSLFSDFPVALNIYNHYRKQWLTAYYQQNGVNIIPTICWSNEDSFDWCFDGVPTGSVVTVASIGVCKSEKTKQAFAKGYEEMKRRINPSTILFFGNPVVEEQSFVSNVIYIETDQQKRLRKLKMQ